MRQTAKRRTRAPEVRTRPGNLQQQLTLLRLLGQHKKNNKKMLQLFFKSFTDTKGLQQRPSAAVYPVDM